MNELDYLSLPSALALIQADTVALGFAMGSDVLTGALLRTLAASKPAAQILELGTGTGLATAWLLDGMDAEARLTTVDNDPACLAIAKRYLGADKRVHFHLADSAEFLAELQGQQFDLIFADTWAGKFNALNLALSLLKRGGFYVIDDLLPQPNWPEGHAPKVPHLIETLKQCRDLTLCPLAWSSGVVVAVKTI
jgi:predicted O-methyltransferase YrrM